METLTHYLMFLLNLPASVSHCELWCFLKHTCFLCNCFVSFPTVDSRFISFVVSARICFFGAKLCVFTTLCLSTDLSVGSGIVCTLWPFVINAVTIVECASMSLNSCFQCLWCIFWNKVVGYCSNFIHTLLWCFSEQAPTHLLPILAAFCLF